MHKRQQPPVPMSRFRRQCVECREYRAASAFRLRSGAYSPICATCRRTTALMTPEQRKKWTARRATARRPLDPLKPAAQDRWKQRAADAVTTASAPTRTVYVAKTKRAKVPSSITADQMPTTSQVPATDASDKTSRK